MRTATPDPGFSQSLERGLAILGAFTPDRPVLGISELARMFSLTRSTTHRYVATLATLGYLQQDEPTRKYRLGPRVLDLGFSVLGSLELREIAAPHLRRLTDITGHTSNLAIRDDTDVILIDRVRGRAGRYHHLEFSLHVGSRLPSYCSATGKALLAFLPPPELDQVLDRIEFVQRGPHTLTSKAALRAELGRVRHTGVAVNDEELDAALRSIAAPVRSRSGEVVAAVNIAIPWSPVAMTDLVSQHGPTLQATAHQIAARVILVPGRAPSELERGAVRRLARRGPDVERDAARARDDDAEVVLGEALGELGGPGGAGGEGRAGPAVAQCVLVRGVEAGEKPEVRPTRRGGLGRYGHAVLQQHDERDRLQRAVRVMEVEVGRDAAVDDPQRPGVDGEAAPVRWQSPEKLRIATVYLAARYGGRHRRLGASGHVSQQG